MCMSIHERFKRRLDPPKIEEIHRLHEMLVKAGIEHEYLSRDPEYRYRGCKPEHCDWKWGYQIIVRDKDGEPMISVVEGVGTYGVEEDRLEIMGLLTEDERQYDSVLGYQLAGEVMERIMAALKSPEE